MQDHVVICGFGTTARAAFAELLRHSRTGTTRVVVIDHDPSAPHGLEQLAFVFLHGDASDPAVLTAAHIARARAVIVALDRDATNIRVTTAVRALNPSARIVTAIGAREAVERLRSSGATTVVPRASALGWMLGEAAMQR